MPERDTRIPCAHVPDRFSYRFLDSFDQDTKARKAAAAATSRLIAGELDSLVLIGGPGCGKSTLLAIACNEISNCNEADGVELRDQVEQARKAEGSYDWNPYAFRDLEDRLERFDRITDRRCPRWINVGILISDLKAEMSSGGHELVDEVRQLRECRGLLVLDDLGRERISEWSAELLYTVASTRYDAQLPTAVSSNVAAADLQRLGYGALLSRWAERGAILELASADYRLRRTA